MNPSRLPRCVTQLLSLKPNTAPSWIREKQQSSRSLVSSQPGWSAAGLPAAGAGPRAAPCWLLLRQNQQTQTASVARPGELWHLLSPCLQLGRFLLLRCTFALLAILTPIVPPVGRVRSRCKIPLGGHRSPACWTPTALPVQQGRGSNRTHCSPSTGLFLFQT